jgi:hypothetical protein
VPQLTSPALGAYRIATLCTAYAEVVNRFIRAGQQGIIDDERLAGGRAGRLLHRLTRRVTALAEPEFVRCMSQMLALGARPEADLSFDSPEHDREDLLTAGTRSGLISPREAEILLVLDQSTTWRTSI